jgi:bifunctional non-homologous end joining protein LigD
VQNWVNPETRGRKIPGSRSRAESGAAGVGRFVVQEHLASRHHYDFRLEIGGALKSWAMPKGPSMDPARKHLAVRVPDHPLSYADFEGIIPEGRYGAGPVVLWDGGRFVPSTDDPEKDLELGKLSFELRGRKLRGTFTLVRLKRGSGNDWLLIKKKDASASRGWRIESELTPSRLRALRAKKPPCEAH